MIVKICGITNVQDAHRALDAGADWIGLNLVAGPRRISRKDAEPILSCLDDPSRAVVLVACARGSVDAQLVGSLRSLGVRRVQLYGEGVSTAVQQLAAEGVESILVQPVADETSLEALDERLQACGDGRPAYLLFDAAATGQQGGSGRVANWEAMAAARSRGLDANWPPFLLAGGLTPANVARAIEKLAPDGVDVSSGVEARPGRKNPARIRDFIAAVRHASGRQP